MIAYLCGLRHARKFEREYVRIMQTANQSIALNMLNPYSAIDSYVRSKPALAGAAA